MQNDHGRAHDRDGDRDHGGDDDDRGYGYEHDYGHDSHDHGRDDDGHGHDHDHAYVSVQVNAYVALHSVDDENVFLSLQRWVCPFWGQSPYTIPSSVYAVLQLACHPAPQ